MQGQGGICQSRLFKADFLNIATKFVAISLNPVSISVKLLMYNRSMDVMRFHLLTCSPVTYVEVLRRESLCSLSSYRG